jgi:hypothetical protein
MPIAPTPAFAIPPLTLLTAAPLIAAAGILLLAQVSLLAATSAVVMAADKGVTAGAVPIPGSAGIER